jgi:hypothetical protein
MILHYWRQVGGTLVTEFPAIAKSPTCGPRRIDAVILPRQELRRASWQEVALEGQDVIAVQAKAERLGMYLMGQALFSAALLERFKPASIRSVALCYAGDSILQPLLQPFPYVEVVVLERQDVVAAEVSP